MSYKPEDLWYTQKHLWVVLPFYDEIKETIVKSKKGGRGNKKITPEEIDEMITQGIQKLDQKNRIVIVGITDLMSEKLGEIDSLELPRIGEDLDIGSRCVHVHLHNVIRPLATPLTGTVVEINEALLDDPNMIHLNPYQHWLFKLEIDEPEEIQLLLNYDQYSELLDRLKL